MKECLCFLSNAQTTFQNRAMYTLFKGFLMEGIVKKYIPDSTQEEAAYNLRFENFKHIGYPAYLGYDQYLQEVKPLEQMNV